MSSVNLKRGLMARSTLMLLCFTQKSDSWAAAWFTHGILLLRMSGGQRFVRGTSIALTSSRTREVTITGRWRVERQARIRAIRLTQLSHTQSTDSTKLFSLGVA